MAPIDGVFREGWHAQVLGAAHALVDAGHANKQEWANTLGAALAKADAEGQPDTEDTYYLCALSALERLTPLHADELRQRKQDWESAYRRTPHGQPVLLE
jgi:nitrile hydratase accessory protein